MPPSARIVTFFFAAAREQRELSDTLLHHLHEGLLITDALHRVVEANPTWSQITGYSRKDAQELCGRTENNRVVNFAGPTNLIGQMVSVKITASRRSTLRGRIA